MAVLTAVNMSGHIQNQLTKSLERILEDANQSGELKLSNRKLKDFPKASSRYNLTDTVVADLSKNRFNELPEEVTGFIFLEKLHCYHNAIRYIPDSVSSLQCLNYLDLSRNQLTSLPREICYLPIQILLVSTNNLTSLPDELSRMSQLTELDASCNQLTHLPPRMSDLRQLQSLVLRNNLLLCVPLELTYLKLVRLDLRANRISTLPVEMRDMTTLIDLLVEDNPLTSPPASLCRRGRVHIFKYLEMEMVRLEGKSGTGSGTLSRRNRRATQPSHLPDRLKQRRQNLDSGYSTSSDGFEGGRWSQELSGDQEKHWSSTRTLNNNNTSHSTLSTPSTISPAPDACPEEDCKNNEQERNEENKNYKDHPSVRLTSYTDSVINNIANGNGFEDKQHKPLQQIQTYREYKEALKQQRAQDVPAIYRTKDPEDHNYKTEPNTPTHQSNRSTLASSKSDPTPLNSVLPGSPKHVFDDTNAKKPVQKVMPSRSGAGGGCPLGGLTTPQPKINGNSEAKLPNKYLQDYVKPKSPLKNYNMGILSHDNVPPAASTNFERNCNTNGTNTNGKPGSPSSSFLNSSANSKGMNGVKVGRSISWNKDVPPEKMSFTMRREIDKAREETDLINQLRNIIETRLKMALPEDLAPALTDGVVLCHLANHIRPRSVASIHVPSPAVPKLTMARCRRNVDNFIEACRKIGVDEERICNSVDVTESLTGRGLPRLLETLEAICELEATQMAREPPGKGRSLLLDATVSLLLLAIFFATVVLLVVFPPPD